MKIVFLLQVHKAYEQVCLLVDYVTSTHHYCIIHVDAKNDILFDNLHKTYEKNKQVFLVEKRVAVYWSGFSQVQATLSMMKLLYLQTWSFDRVHLMSGEDLPIKQLSYIETFLEDNKHKEFINYQNIDQYEWRLKRYCILTENKYNRTFFIRGIQKISRVCQFVLPKRNILKDKTLYKGSSWFNISHEAFIFIMHFLEKNKAYLNDFKYAACADEHFFQILLLNSTFKNNIVNHNLYYIEIPKNVSSPRYLVLKDIEVLKDKKDILFARKFKKDISEIYIQHMRKK